MRTSPIGLPRFNEQENGSLRPSPLVSSCCRHNWQATLWHALLPWPCKMSAPFYFKPHGGPITRSSTASKPDSPVHPRFLKLFLAFDFLCNSRATCQVIYSGIRRNTYSRCSESPFTFWLSIERLPIRLKLLMVPPYFALDIFLRFNSRVTFRHLPKWLSTG